MSIELKQAAQQAIEALEWYVENDDVVESMPGNEFWVGGKREAEKAIQELRTAIQQPATTEPAGYLYDFKYDDEIVRDWFTQNIDEIQFRPATCLNIRPLYAHPAPGVPDDVARDAERWRVSELISEAALKHPDSRTEAENKAFNAYRTAFSSGNSYASCIDAAMLASPAQKGGE